MDVYWDKNSTLFLNWVLWYPVFLCKWLTCSSISTPVKNVHTYVCPWMFSSNCNTHYIHSNTPYSIHYIRIHRWIDRRYLPTFHKNFHHFMCRSIISLLWWPKNSHTQPPPVWQKQPEALNKGTRSRVYDIQWWEYHGLGPVIGWPFPYESHPLWLGTYRYKQRAYRWFFKAKGLEFGIARTPFHDMYQQCPGNVNGPEVLGGEVGREWCGMLFVWSLWL